MAHSLLQQLLFIVRRLLLRLSGRPSTLPFHQLFRKLALLWSLVRPKLCIGWPAHKARGENKSTGTRSISPRPDNDDTTEPRSTILNGQDETQPTTPFTPAKVDGQIPLDDIACSLHPYPYINHNASRSSLNSGLRAARSAHSLAISSRNASRSSQQLGTHSVQGYTFTYQSPDRDHHPHSPTPRRGYSISSPHLTGTGTGYGHDSNIIELSDRVRSPSPASSIVALPAGVFPDLNGNATEINLSHERIFPIAPEFFQRYDRSAFAKKEDTKLMIKSLTVNFRSHPDPPGWKPCLHPEGVLYFYNDRQRVVSEANLYDDKYYKQITEDVEIIEDFIRAQNLQLPPNTTLALDLNMDPDGTIITDYYFADHDKKIIFFLDDFEASQLPVWQEVKGVTSTDHIHHEFEAQYWLHCMLYPRTLDITQDHVNELRDIVMHYIGDAMTSTYSTAPYHLDDLHKILSLSDSLNHNVGAQYTGSSSLLSRMMFVLTRQKFYNWHGTAEARIYRDQSVHGKKIQRTALIRTLSPLLFSAPDVHLANLEKMWVDGIMHGAVWLQSIAKLNTEWQEFILYATVLLNANVAFLAIQSVDIGESPYRSPIQIASYLSIVSSIGSIILGLLLVRQNRTKAHGTASDVSNFLKARSHPTLGLETLAILYSLPYALLMWGMVSFLAAFAINCFDNSNIPTRTIMGSGWFILGTLVLWCIWMGWEKTVHSEPDQPTEKSTEESEGEPTDKSGSRSSSVGTPPASEIPENQIQVKTKKRWSWPALFIFNRRTSYDSDRTAV